ncbi:unnamed protein product [Rotaria sp. Silwood1]|nr:unnamed protein product [Rotaria sp. Silwood1]
MMINSPPLHSNSNKRLRFSIPRNKNNDLLINSTTEKFEDINNNNNNHHYQQEKNSIDCNNIMKQEILVSNTNTNNNNNENDTTLLTTTTTTTTVEFKVKTTKTSSRKRKSNVINDINNDNINKEQLVSKKKKKQRMTKLKDELNNNKKTLNLKTNDQSSSTDETSFGSCEPGTNVVLQGIVWNETDKGVLVVNITWRGKTYVGALLNTTEQNWAPPRYKSDIRSTIKQNHNRDHQLNSTYETTERILRNGKRRCSTTTTTVIPNSTTKINSFKMPEIPPTKIDDNRKIIEKFIIPSSSSSLNTNHNDDDEINEEKTLIKNLTINIDEDLGDNYSSHSISPLTSGTSTTSSSPLLSNNIENHTTIPIDLSNSKLIMNIEENKTNTIIQQTSNDKLIPYHFTNDMLYSTNSFNLGSFNKLSSTSHTIPTQVYLNTSNYSSLSKSLH